MLRLFPVVRRSASVIGRRDASSWAHISYDKNLAVKEAMNTHSRRHSIGEMVDKNTMLVVDPSSLQLGVGNFDKVSKYVTYSKKITTVANPKGGFDVNEEGSGVAEILFWRHNGELRCHYNPIKDVPNDPIKDISNDPIKDIPKGGDDSE